MSVENKALYQQFIDAMKTQVVTAVDRFMDPNIVGHDLPPASQPALAKIGRTHNSPILASYPHRRNSR